MTLGDNGNAGGGTLGVGRRSCSARLSSTARPRLFAFRTERADRRITEPAIAVSTRPPMSDISKPADERALSREIGRSAPPSIRQFRGVPSPHGRPWPDRGRTRLRWQRPRLFLEFRPRGLRPAWASPPLRILSRSVMTPPQFHLRPIRRSRVIAGCEPATQRIDTALAIAAVTGPCAASPAPTGLRCSGRRPSLPICTSGNLR